MARAVSGLSTCTLGKRCIGSSFIKLTGTTQKIVFKDLPKDDPTQRRPDIAKAKKILGWEPKVSRAEGLKITYEAFKALPKDVLHKQEHRDFEGYVRK